MSQIGALPTGAVDTLDFDKDRKPFLRDVATGFRNFFNAVQIICNAVTRSGTTAQRPTTGVWIGMPYFDTTLGQEIYVSAATASSVTWYVPQTALIPWTPAITFATPGDFAATYSSQAGSATKTGRLTVATFTLVTSSFTFTTASGNLQITGIPFTVAADTGYRAGVRWAGITKAGYTDIVLNAGTSATVLLLLASGSGQPTVTVTAADMPTGGSVILQGTIVYVSAT